MKKLGFGLMRLPALNSSNDADVDIEYVNKMVDLFIERGFTYFDTALMYCGGASEKIAKTVLVDRHPRENFALADKLHAGFFNSYEGRDKVFHGQLEKTGAGYFDYYLLHGIDSSLLSKYEQFDCFNWLLEKRAQGLVKHVGFSYHDSAELLDDILTRHPEMEFVQLQINYLDWESEWIQARACYEAATRHGKPVIVMEPVKGGSLAKVPEEAEKLLKEQEPDMSIPSWAIRFAASLPNVTVVLSGMSSLEQMEDNLSYMENFKPLTEDEMALCHKVANLINSQIAIPCTGCSYCTEGCPMKIAIPQYFSLYNENMREHLEEKGFTANFLTYDNLAEKSGRAKDCTQCGHCESMCPQHLPIIENLKAVSEHFDR